MKVILHPAAPRIERPDVLGQILVEAADRHDGILLEIHPDDFALMDKRIGGRVRVTQAVSADTPLLTTGYSLPVSPPSKAAPSWSPARRRSDTSDQPPGAAKAKRLYELYWASGQPPLLLPADGWEMRGTGIHFFVGDWEIAHFTRSYLAGMRLVS
ncbi:MAG: hypothetical protein MUF31_15420 [Akkermansiaceae bacterium]|jgi:hypothetical protein|nr:hypothetical protein [Akkermansiaceae bacterium]